jgi:transposase
MALESVDVIIGVDVCKERLDLFEYHGERSCSISNDAATIKIWMDELSGRVKLALEPTNRYHLGLAEVAYARGHDVYLIDPYRLSYYRAGLGRRAKADAQDAQLLKRRAALVGCKAQLKQSLAELG